MTAPQLCTCSFDYEYEDKMNKFVVVALKLIGLTVFLGSVVSCSICAAL